jgi:inner membrane protein
MTGRTHDLMAFTALNYIIATQPLQPMELSTVLVAFGANFVGGLAPDLDQPTGELWGRIRGGSVLGKLIAPIMGGHRFISHSLVGVYIWGWALRIVLSWVHTFLLVDMDVVWWAFMIGYVSHLVIDMITKDGVPWLFPLPLRFGIPPFRWMRIKTGGLVEKSLVFPGLMAVNGLIFYVYYDK